MNYIDIIILVFIIIAAVKGYMKGIIYQLASLLSIVFGIYLAIKFSLWAAPFFQKLFSFSLNTSIILAFVLIFILVALGIYFIGKSLEKALDDIELTPINKLAGLVFGVAKTILVLSVLMFFLRFSEKTRQWPSDESKQTSFLFERVESIAPALFPYFVKKD